MEDLEDRIKEWELRYYGKLLDQSRTFNEHLIHEVIAPFYLTYKVGAGG